MPIVPATIRRNSRQLILDAFRSQNIVNPRCRGVRGIQQIEALNTVRRLAHHLESNVTAQTPKSADRLIRAIALIASDLRHL